MRAERAEEHLAGIGREDQAERDEAGDEGADLDLAVADEAGDAAEQDLPAEIDEEQRQELGQAAEDRGEDVAGDPEPAAARIPRQRRHQSDRKAKGKRGEREPYRQPGPGGEFVTPAVRAETEQPECLTQPSRPPPPDSARRR